MRRLPTSLAAHLAGDATTLCQCWRVTRRDGVVIGFTEHDRDLTVDGTLFRAASGFRASEAEAALGLAIDAGEVAGAFSSEAISEADVAAGRFDGARVEVWLVNWAAPDQATLLRVQEIGEVRRAGMSFRAELRGLTHRLNEPRGRVYGRRCDANFGDARCGLSLSVRQEVGTILSVAGPTALKVGGLNAPEGSYRFGVIELLDGPAAGFVADLDDEDRLGTVALLSLFLPPAVPPAPGDRVRVTFGCDKSFRTCRDLYDNAVNFRGFPHLPGSDFSYGYADEDTVHDGRPLFD
ncbi:DUF2163 domain-containing protein [Rhizobium sp. YIM 134829]|uniref:DUF2163 domain-containing protein n=1 Tax=Rhizobium sp. YIM 134829 TaxID=3390453 RepID=UPI0039782A1C